MIMGPRRGIFHDPRGCTSRKKKSISTEKDHRIKSYSQPMSGGIYCCCFPMVRSGPGIPRGSEDSEGTVDGDKLSLQR